MEDFLEMVYYCYHTKDALYYHPVIALTMLTKTQIGHFLSPFAKTIISQNGSLVIPQSGNIPENLIVIISRIPTPIDHLTPPA
jgi:hypothetical protein